jgi:two-component system LytT family response regulator
MHMPSSLSPDSGLRTLVVDDEELACRGLRRKLLASGAVAAAETTTDPAHAVVRLRDDPPDVVFLDVQMPGLSGFDVLAQFPEPERSFAVVFCTAYDAHATRAFEAAALDYLVKPVDAARLSAALARVRRFVQTIELRSNAVSTSELARARGSGLFAWLERLVVRSRNGARVVDVSDVVAFASEAHRAVAYTPGEEHVLDPSLAAIEPQLDPSRFARCHRAFIVNLTRVEAVSGDTISLTGGRAVPLSRRNRKVFLDALAAVHRR